jgi:hypothetical protein
MIIVRMICLPNFMYHSELKPLYWPFKIPIWLRKGKIFTFKLINIRMKPKLTNWIHIIPMIESMRFVVSSIGLRKEEAY